MTDRRQQAVLSNGDGLALSHASLANLYRTHWVELCRYVAARFGAGPPEPEEVAQAAFARYAALDTPEKIEDPRRFLHSIACNIVTDHHRRANFRTAVHRDMAAQADESQLSDFSPEQLLLAKERLAIMEKALAAMPATRRRMFLLVRVEGQSIAEVARRFGMSESAVRKAVWRGLQDCAAALQAADKPSGGRR